MHRFYATDSLELTEIELPADEAAHLLRVLRLGVGERVTVFDGHGRSAVAEVAETRKRSVRLKVEQRLPATTPHGPKVTLLTAIPKADRVRWLVEKATELGVSRVVPIRTARSVVHPHSGKLQKMQAAAIAACKQCGRNDLPAIDELRPWDEALSAVADQRLLVADPGGRPLAEAITAVPAGGRLALAIGPEGGLTAEELESARAADADFVSLGPSILRIETAAIAMTACVRLLGRE